MLRTLVVNADDLGLTLGVNDGMFDADARGVLTRPRTPDAPGEPGVVLR
jgi:predicted glycoside hydrolase/deacetylase ChbG (UPF0249 family)